MSTTQRGKNESDTSKSGNKGGTQEQHVEAGRQSHKNSDSSQSGTSDNRGGGSGGSGGSGSRSGTNKQHVDAGRQSHKNDK
ncbi:hypothetical protein IMCC9480_1362 [Oxalobacteraceae bacterium IMCC9480]|nr:hypothetical protein IMCC9480_1362 [Oxalobacteraceae bacterium IMCC9480]